LISNFLTLRKNNADSAKNIRPLEKKIRPKNIIIGHLAALVTEGSKGLPSVGSDGVFTKLTFFKIVDTF
jgi:hypothetical protein